MRYLIPVLIGLIAVNAHASDSAVAHIAVAHIAVARNFSPQYFNSTMVIELDGKEQCRLDIGDSCAFDALPGTYRLAVSVEHWLKPDEHSGDSVTLKPGQQLSYEVGYGCNRLVSTGTSPFIPTCSGKAYIRVAED